MTWIERDGALHREIRTPDFMTAFHLVSALVAPAEALNHHPDIEFGWGYVRIRLTTHDAGGVTGQDRLLAARIDAAILALDI
jgi:4a-hydroxytetrahydrobiopterin dehydratase